MTELYYNNYSLDSLVYTDELGNICIEQWRDIPCYEGYYQASNLGRIKGLKRQVKNSRNDSLKLRKESILKQKVHNNSYISISLNKEGKRKGNKVHILIMSAFEGNSNLTVDHKNRIKYDNRLVNLRYCTQRENNRFYNETQQFSSQYIGVMYEKRTKKWWSYINIKNYCYSLGYYEKELDAVSAYNKALYNYEKDSILPSYKNPNHTSKYQGVTFHKRDQKWTAYYKKDGKRKYIGYFNSEEEAYKKLLEINK